MGGGQSGGAGKKETQDEAYKCLGRELNGM